MELQLEKLMEIPKYLLNEEYKQGVIHVIWFYSISLYKYIIKYHKITIRGLYIDLDESYMSWVKRKSIILSSWYPKL